MALPLTNQAGGAMGCGLAVAVCGVSLFSAMYGRDFTAENDLLAALDIDALSLSQLQALCRDGYAH